MVAVAVLSGAVAALGGYYEWTKPDEPPALDWTSRPASVGSKSTLNVFHRAAKLPLLRDVNDMSDDDSDGDDGSYPTPHTTVYYMGADDPGEPGQPAPGLTASVSSPGANGTQRTYVRSLRPATIN